MKALFMILFALTLSLSAFADSETATKIRASVDRLKSIDSSRLKPSDQKEIEIAIFDLETVLSNLDEVKVFESEANERSPVLCYERDHMEALLKRTIDDATANCYAAGMRTCEVVMKNTSTFCHVQVIVQGRK